MSTKRLRMFAGQSGSGKSTISRINHRVKVGGHDVPAKKVVERYYRSLKLLKEAIKHTNRAYIFDNSGDKAIWLAEITDGTTLEIKSEVTPAWFKEYLL